MRASTLLAFLLFTPLMGCPPAEDKDDTAPVDTDTNTGEDDNVAPPYSFSGEVTVSSTYDGDVICDATATLTGTPYTGECEGCDFAVDIDDEVTTDNSSADCGYYSLWSYIETDELYDLVLAHADSYDDYSDAQLTIYGYTYFLYDTYAYEYPGPYTRAVTYADSPYGTFTRTGDDISWTFGYDYPFQSYDPTYYNDCGVEYSYNTGAYPADTYGTSSLPCDGYSVDVWSFTSAGGTVNLTVDTVADDTAFDTKMWVNGPDECTLAWADDNFDCTFTPAAYQCSSLTLGTTDADDYQVVVGSWGSCNGSEGAYRLDVDGGTAPTLDQDDAEAYVLADHEIIVSVSGSGTLTAE